MKLVKKGTPKDAKVYTGFCQRCGSEYRASDDEVEEVLQTEPFLSIVYKQADCGICNSKASIYFKQK